MLSITYQAQILQATIPGMLSYCRKKIKSDKTWEKGQFFKGTCFCYCFFQKRMKSLTKNFHLNSACFFVLSAFFVTSAEG